MTVIINGKEESSKLRGLVRDSVSRIKKDYNFVPGLAVILVGDDPASRVYVRNKEAAAQELGLETTTYRLPAEAGQHEVIDIIKRLNNDSNVHGILVQMPLPKGYDYNEIEIIDCIDPLKDVDGLHSLNIGKLILKDNNAMLPCTPLGCRYLWRTYIGDIAGKRVVVAGRSKLVGLPTFMLSLHDNGVATIVHSKTKDAFKIYKEADIIIAAIGKPHEIKSNYLKPGVSIFDVGISKVNDKLLGDVDFDDCKDICQYITPVPGGIGPMTVAFLMINTLKAACIIHGLKGYDEKVSELIKLASVD